MARPTAASLALALALSVGSLAAAADKFGSLTVDQVEEKLKQPSTYAYDCNPPDVYAHSHLPRAKWVDYNNVQASDLPPSKSATLVFYCANEH